MAMKLRVDGIHCIQCVKRITGAIQKAVPGARVSIDVEKGVVDVDGSTDKAKVIGAIEDAGYALAAAA